MSNMSAIGFPITTEDSVKALAAQTALRGEQVPTRHGNISYARWDVGAGLQLFAQVVATRPQGRHKEAKASAVGLNPYVDGAARMRIAVREVRWDKDNPFEARVHVAADPKPSGTGYEGAYEFWFDSPDALSSWAGEIAEIRTLHLAGLAQTVEVFADAGAHRAAQAGREVIAEAESFLSAPIAGDDPETSPGVTLSGYLRGAEQRENAVTGRTVWVLQVQTLGGEVDVVCSPEDVTGQPRPGTVVQALCYLVGRPVS